MISVTADYTGSEGKVVPMGDSITYLIDAGLWVRSGKGKTKEEQQICDWMNADRDDASNGWYLAAVDRGHGRSETAACGCRSDEFIRGGKGGLPPLEEILKRRNPQIAVVLLGTNDLGARVPPEKYLSNMETIYRMCLKNGTIPLVNTIPPTTWDSAGYIKQYNRGLIRLAEKYKLPVVDVYGEFLSRRPGDAWKGTLVSNDGAHLTTDHKYGPATEDNLKNSGNLLRAWLNVHKIIEIKNKVIDKS